MLSTHRCWDWALGFVRKTTHTTWNNTVLLGPSSPQLLELEMFLCTTDSEPTLLEFVACFCTEAPKHVRSFKGSCTQVTRTCRNSKHFGVLYHSWVGLNRRAGKAHKNLAHKTLSGHPGHLSSRSGHLGKTTPFSALRITRKKLTPGHTAKRLPPHRRGHWLRRSMFTYLFLS